MDTIEKKLNASTVTSNISESEKDPVAIVGIGCRFPGGVSDPESFWELITEGKDAIVDIPEDRWDVKRFYDPDHNKPGKMYVKSGGFLQQDLNEFDALFFGIAPREADCLDPQQRVLMEVAWEALEDAGVTSEALAGSNTGVYIGAFTLDNKLTQMSGVNRERIGPHTAVGSTMTILSNRISYCFDLRGPSISVDTACSSSLVAFHYACEAIQQGDCEMAMAGGVNIIHRPEYMIAMCKGQFLAEDGHCKSFDSRADGYARGEGAGIVVLKKLSAAVRDGDQIYAVVRGSGVNQDGRTSAITVPNGDAQEALVKQVCEKAGVAVNEIAYVEAHGTGTPIGDPTEAGALGRALGKDRDKDKACYISSVKANIGHLEAASGIAGVIKTALSLKKKQIPLLANLQQPNPDIPFSELGLKLPLQNESMPNYSELALAGVNSFGYGGTNAHVILQQAPEQQDIQPAQEQVCQGPWLLPLSARNDVALKAVAEQYLEMMIETKFPDFSAICYSASVRKTHHEYRLAIPFNSKDQLIEQLKLFIDGQPGDKYVSSKVNSSQIQQSKPVFVFTGMGPQWWAMGRELINNNVLFREAVEQCDIYFKAEANWSILDEMLASEEHSRITETQIAQPANLVIQIGLLAILESWEIEPAAIVGHSVGEVSAAYAAGAISLEDAIKISFHRGRIQSQAAGKGKMLAVGLTEVDAAEILKPYKDKVSFAAINSPSSLTLAGDGKALEEIAEKLEKQEVFNRFLKVEVPYHSPAMDSLKPALREAFSGLKAKQPKISLYSTVTSQQVDVACHHAEYWCDNVRQPVLFAKTMENIINDEHRVFLEIGPHPVLSSSIKETMMRSGTKGHVIATLRREQPEQFNMLKTLAELYVAGSPVNWKKAMTGGTGFISLPHYPWQKSAFWAESEEALLDRIGTQAHPLLNQTITAPSPVWESAIGSGMIPYLPDHVVDGVQVLPGAAYVEIGLALSKLLNGNAVQGLLNLKFHNALVISEGDEPLLRVHYEAQKQQFFIYSRTRDNKELWTLHAEGTIWSGDLTNNMLVDINDIRNRCNTGVETEKLYQQLSNRGLRYGEWFQGINQLWVGNDEVLAEIKSHDGVKDEQHYLLHPTLLDACFQSLICLLSDDQDSAYLPVEIEHIALYQQLPEKFFMHGILSNRSDTSINGDLVLFDKQGNTLAEISGLRCQALVAGHTRFDREMNNWLYQYNWQPVETKTKDSAIRGGHWLIFDDGSSLVDKLSYVIKKLLNGTLIRVTAGDRFQKNQVGDYQIRQGQIEDYQKILDGVPELAGIAYFWGSEESNLNNLAEDAQKHAEALLNLIKSLQNNQRHLNSRLYTVTRGAQQVLETDRMQPNPQWALLGLSRVAFNELVNHHCTLIDIDVVEHKVNLGLLAKELLSDCQEDEVALRDEQRFSHCLERISVDALDEQSLPSHPKTVSENRSYEIVAKRGQAFYQNSVRHSPKADEIEIELHSVALTRHDYDLIQGTEGEIHKQAIVLGNDVAHGYTGVVSRIGSSVKNFKTGDSLVGYANIGLNSFITLSSRDLVAVQIDQEIVSAQFAPIAEQYIPIYYGLSHKATITPGDTLLIYGENIEQEKVAVQVANFFGAKILLAGKREEWRNESELSMISAFVDPENINFIHHVKELTRGKGVDIIVNLCQISNGHNLADTLASFAQIIDFSGTGLVANQLADNHVLNSSYIRIDAASLIQKPLLFKSLLVDVIQLIEAKQIVLTEHAAYPSIKLKEAINLHADLLKTDKTILKFHDQPVLDVFYPNEMPELIEPDVSYLITGGFGGFGAKIAHWLVDKGATQLILVGRRGASTAASKTLVVELEKKGAEVLTVAADITLKADVNRLIKQITGSMKPLHGVFHAAALLDDAPLLELDKQRLDKVMAPKIKGAWNLHLATQKLPLKYFVLFSSVSSLIGNTRQGNYVAANTFLDQLAVYRHGCGLCASSVNWGAISAAGMAANNKEVETHLQLMGMKAFSAEYAMEAFNKVCAYQPAQIGIMDVNWYRWSQYEPKGGASPRFIELVKAESEADNQESGDLLANQLIALDENSRLEMLSLLIAEQVSETLRLPSDAIDITHPLTQMGIDSLLGVELQIGLNMKFGIELSALELIKGNNIIQIAEIALKKLNLDDISTENTSEVTVPNQTEQDINDLNHEALDELLSQLMIKEEV
ncbi:MAG: SDR family NAD(P)-dependent oxidoreductase [Methylococcaceae bacterium]